MGEVVCVCVGGWVGGWVGAVGDEVVVGKKLRRATLRLGWRWCVRSLVLLRTARQP